MSTSINSPFRTSTDLVTEALANLGVLAAGQPIDVEDFSFVNEKLDSIFRKLAALEISYIPDPNNIPGALFADLADIVAGECASKFGLVGQEFMDKVNKGLGGAGQVPIGAGTAAMSLKIINRGRPTYEPLRMQSI
jgi:hypothetical protein